jgi:hypothetical protein
VTEAEVKVLTGLWVSGIATEPQRVKVTGGDYVYLGWLVGMSKKLNGVIRANVQDETGRLFIHNAGQVEVVKVQ